MATKAENKPNFNPIQNSLSAIFSNLGNFLSNSSAMLVNINKINAGSIVIIIA